MEPDRFKVITVAIISTIRLNSALAKPIQSWRLNLGVLERRAAPPSDPECILPNEYYYSVEASGADGFYDSDFNTWRDGVWSDWNADTSQPGQWSYTLNVWIDDGCHGQQAYASNWEQSAAPRVVGADIIFDGYTGSNVCWINNQGQYYYEPWHWVRAYQYYDQWGAYMTRPVLFHEAIIEDFDGCDAPGHAQDGWSDGNGVFFDHFAICSHVCEGGTPCTSQDEQYVYGDGVFIRHNTLQYMCNGFGIWS